MSDEQPQEQDDLFEPEEVSEDDSKSKSSKSTTNRSSGAVPFLESLAGDLWKRNQALEEALAEGSEHSEREQANKSSDPIAQFSDEDTQAVFLVSQLAKERNTTIADLWADGLEAIEKLSKIERDAVINKLCEHHGLKSKIVSRLLDGIHIEPEIKKIQRQGRTVETYAVNIGNDLVPVEEYLSEYIDDIRDLGDKYREIPVPMNPKVRAAPHPIPGRSGGSEERVREELLRSGRYFRF